MWPVGVEMFMERLTSVVAAGGDRGKRRNESD